MYIRAKSQTFPLILDATRVAHLNPPLLSVVGLNLPEQTTLRHVRTHTQQVYFQVFIVYTRNAY